MPKTVDLETEIKQFIIQALLLEDVTCADIESDAPLFVDGLGLEPIDALELAMAREEHFGVMIDEDPDVNREIFTSVKTLATYVVSQRGIDAGQLA